MCLLGVGHEFWGLVFLWIGSGISSRHKRLGEWCLSEGILILCSAHLFLLFVHQLNKPDTLFRVEVVVYRSSVDKTLNMFAKLTKTGSGCAMSVKTLDDSIYLLISYLHSNFFSSKVLVLSLSLSVQLLFSLDLSFEFSICSFIQRSHFARIALQMNLSHMSSEHGILVRILFPILFVIQKTYSELQWLKTMRFFLGYRFYRKSCTAVFACYLQFVCAHVVHHSNIVIDMQW